MRKQALALVPLLLAVPLAVAALRAQATQTTAFVDVTVIPMDRETTVPGQTVIVRDGKIAEIGPAGKTTVPADAMRVEGKGKFLMPALAEMHAHIPAGKAPDDVIERTLYLYAASGIGTIRGMLGDPRHLTYRDRAAKGEIVSPRVYTSGPSLNGNSVPTKDAAIAAVTAQKAAGYDLLKIHPGITRDVFDALAAKAQEVGITFAGHVPLDVGLQRALETKYRSIDHLDGYVEALSKKPETSQFFGVNLMDQIDESKLPALVKETKAAGVWQVPTQVLMDNLLGPDDPEAMAKWPEMKYVPAAQLQNFVTQKQGFIAKIPAADRERFLTLRRKILKALYDGGVPFALGSDAPQTYNVPGFSVHRELQAIVKAGLTPFQALQTGTANVGVYFGTADSTGTVTRGKRADLLLLDANPLTDIANSSRIAGVMLNGRWISRADIDKRLATILETQ